MPISHYASNIFNDGVFVDIDVYAGIPESGANIKDAVNNAVIKRFHSKLKSKKEAQSWLQVNVKSITQSPIAYNESGFISYYRTNIILEFSFENVQGDKFSVINSGYYDYSADYTSTIVLEQYRLNSISNAAGQAIDKFISQIAYYGEFYDRNR